MILNGDDLRRLRIKARYSKSEAGRKMKVDRKTISNWEDDIGGPSFNQLWGYSKLLGINALWFVKRFAWKNVILNRVDVIAYVTISIAYVIISISIGIGVTNSHGFMVYYLAMAAFTMLRSKNHINILTIILILCTFKVLEFILFPNIRELGNYVVYPTWIAIDIAVAALIILRPTISRKVDVRADKNFYVLTNADVVISGIYILYVLINIAALVEHVLRHLDDFGFPPDAGYVLFLNENARIIYELFPHVKHTLNALELIAICTTITSYMRSQRIFEA